MNTPEGTIGYAAVVLPHLDEYQGFFVIKNDLTDRLAFMSQMAAMVTSPRAIEGPLQAAIVEGVITQNWEVVAANARALYGITKEPYFWIEATKEIGGTRTQMHLLNARSPDEAREEIEGLALVRLIKSRAIPNLLKRKH